MIVTEYQQARQYVINYLRRVDPEQFNGPLAHPDMLDDPVDDDELIYLASEYITSWHRQTFEPDQIRVQCEQILDQLNQQEA